MFKTTIFLLFSASVLFQCATLQDVPERPSFSSETELSPRVEPSSSRANRTTEPLNARRTLTRSSVWTPMTTASPKDDQIATTAATAKNMTELEVIQERWRVFERTMKKTISGHMKKALPVFLRMGSDANLSADCSKGIMALVQGVRGLKSWAFRSKSLISKLHFYFILFFCLC